MASAMIKTIRRNAKTYSLQLAGSNSIVNGYAQEVSTTANNIEAHIQPMGDKDLRNVPEGQNTLQWIVIWSESNVPTKSKITYGGIVFTVQKVQFWEDGAFYKSAAVYLED